MERLRPRKSKKSKPNTSVDRDVRCAVCGSEQKNQSERFRVCSGCKEQTGTKRYFCSRACQKADWKTHKDFCGSQDFWDYPHKPLLRVDAQFERPAALRCQIALIDSDPDVLYNIAPCTDDALRFAISDKMMNISFRRVRDKAFLTRDPESIAALGQTLVSALETEETSSGMSPTAARVAQMYRQLEDEYAMSDIEAMVLELLNEQRLDPLSRTKLECLHQENMAKHGSEFWKALARPID
ncbi:hypothetical protein B0H10DRAFT_2439731 [Mycena sp. CBHHK59/15]|nr:hypothetical protein B0H10DRAFT_2439731 [Mycena sp. CBHHK59/15]